MPAQSERLAGVQSGVGEHGDERRVKASSLTDEMSAHRLDRLRRERADDSRPGLTRLRIILAGLESRTRHSTAHSSML